MSVTEIMPTSCDDMKVLPIPGVAREGAGEGLDGVVADSAPAALLMMSEEADEDDDHAQDRRRIAPAHDERSMPTPEDEGEDERQEERDPIGQPAIDEAEAI